MKRIVPIIVSFCLIFAFSSSAVDLASEKTQGELTAKSQIAMDTVQEAFSPDEIKILPSIQKAQEAAPTNLSGTNPAPHSGQPFTRYGDSFFALTFLIMAFDAGYLFFRRKRLIAQRTAAALLISAVNATLVLVLHIMIFRSAFSFALITGAAQESGTLAAFGRATTLLTPILYLVVLGLCLKIRAGQYGDNEVREPVS